MDLESNFAFYEIGSSMTAMRIGAMINFSLDAFADEHSPKSSVDAFHFSLQLVFIPTIFC